MSVLCSVFPNINMPDTVAVIFKYGGDVQFLSYLIVSFTNVTSRDTKGMTNLKYCDLPNINIMHPMSAILDFSIG